MERKRERDWKEIYKVEGGNNEREKEKDYEWKVVEVRVCVRDWYMYTYYIASPQLANFNH